MRAATQALDGTPLAVREAARARMRPALLGLAIAAVLLPAPGTLDVVRGHGGNDVRLQTVLGALPPELAGMRVEVHETVAPQLVLENPTDRTVEVLDPSGVPFLRIGPAGVEGNVAAKAWYETYSPGQAAPSERRLGGDPRWVVARREPSFGWFDPRLDASDVTVPHAVADAGRPARVGTWSIAIRVDGRAVELAGEFRFAPAPHGAYEARLTSPAEIAPGVRVRILPGRPAGLYVESSSESVLSVLDHAGRAFLQIGPGGVLADVGSAAWRRSGRAARRTAAPGEPARAGWQRISTVPRFSWLDPRTALTPGARPPRDGTTGLVKEWSVPMRLGDEPLRVTGELLWREAASH